MILVHYYEYGMMARGCSPGCQPSDFAFYEDVDNVPEGAFYSILWYTRRLTKAELDEYDLVFIRDYYEE